MTTAKPSAPSRSRERPAVSEGERALLQARLGLLGSIGCVLSLAFYAVVHSLASSPPGRLPGLPYGPQDLGILWVAATFGVAWGLGRAGALPAPALRALDLFVVLSAAGGCAVHGWVGPDAAAFRFDAVLALNNILVVRAVLVPSGPRRTLALAAAAGLPVLGPALTQAFGTPPPADLVAARLDAALFAGWTVVAAAVSTVVSATVFGLRRDLGRARRLGQYTLVRRIGRGSAGEVWRARHALLRRAVAIKLLRPERAHRQEVERFTREVRITAGLSNPNTVEIYDYGTTPDGRFYYVMELLPGLDLRALVDQQGPQPAARVLHLLEQVCGSLREAHAAGLVHRDIKAANVILCERGGVRDVVKVLDFGLAVSTTRLRRRDAGEPLHVVGTPAWMPPEAFDADGQADARSDLWAVGLLGWFLLTGEMPFAGETVEEVVAAIVLREPERPSDLVDGVPESLERPLLRCLRKDPAERPASADELLALLMASRGDAGRWTQANAAALAPAAAQAEGEASEPDVGVPLAVELDGREQSSAG